MNSPSSTIRSSAALACALLLGCGGSKAPDPEPAAQDYSASDSPDKRVGTLTFHYANKSTDANMALDLGVEDVFLDMSGTAVKPEPPTPPTPRQRREAQPADPDSPLPERTAPAAMPGNTPPRPGPEAAAPAPSPQRAAPRPDPRQEMLPPESDDNQAPPDVTDKVLSGIRKAQEFFYQKRYTEALDMVRSSLDARPTAEGHALAGSIHYMLSQPGLAKRHWQEALRLNPDMPAVVNMLEKIRTPGGRGSPYPRPIVQRRAAPAPSSDVMDAAKPVTELAPYPEEYGPDGAKSAPAAPAAPAPAAGKEGKQP